ncbi:MAG: CDP-alcohol phosphatidyltransferase family protein [Prevotellaceae bacterium]|nr:CDP-alcohol phosphatidyltransferase family protein [Prevotellaceae bacterium]
MGNQANVPAAQGCGLMARVRATMKSVDVEGPFELYATRTPGFLLALGFRALGLHPVAVTLASMALGVAAAVFFSADTAGVRLWGVVMLLLANWMDCADGQLARMTGKCTQVGRVLDGFAGDLWFFAIYFAICWQLTPRLGLWIWLLAAWAGFYCHARQCALADYYRQAHLYFASGGASGELDSSEALGRHYAALGWTRSEWFTKLYEFFYIRYTRGQEKATPRFQRLLGDLRTGRMQLTPTLGADFRKGSLPLMPWCQVLTFDVRFAVLAVAATAGAGWAYFVFEATLMEVLRLVVRSRHEALCQQLADKAPGET